MKTVLKATLNFAGRCLFMILCMLMVGFSMLVVTLFGWPLTIILGIAVAHKIYLRAVEGHRTSGHHHWSGRITPDQGMDRNIKRIHSPGILPRLRIVQGSGNSGRSDCSGKHDQ